jgi:DNA adenine methylase
VKIRKPSSPLRYPGGKQILARVIASFIEGNGLDGCVYAEPYAGGAGAALSLLYSEHVSRILLNDADPCVFAFWRSVLTRTDDLLRLVRDTPLTITEWKRQREIYRSRSTESQLRLGFATFYLNRTNRSGIIKDGGAIGGIDQRGEWKLDARFNRLELNRRLARVAMYKTRISVTKLDALLFMQTKVEPIASTSPRGTFVYLDPPYYNKGSELYLNYYSPQDHQALASYLHGSRAFEWILTYDRSRPIIGLYSWAKQFCFKLPYSAHRRRDGHEVLVVAPGLRTPKRWRLNI